LAVILLALAGGLFLTSTVWAAAKATATKAVVAEEATPEVSEAETTGASSTESLDTMSLEALMGLNIMVTSSARKAEELRDATSSIYVITSEDIRRSGHKTLPEALRLVPGVQVARQSAGLWAISTRGFDAIYNNKMLVLIDGRSVYNNNTAGVHWDLQDTLLEDVDRIEVIRGPGGTLWGANAVNGIINVITKSAKDTQGMFAAQYVGSSDLLSATAFRAGSLAGEHGHFRVWAKSANTRTTKNALDQPNNDSWNKQMAGARGDWSWAKDNLSINANALHSKIHLSKDNYFNLLTLSTESASGIPQRFSANGTVKWTHQLSETSDFELQGYYDWVNWTELYSNDEKHRTTDVQAQHRFNLAAKNEVTWGAGFRYNDEVMPVDPAFAMESFKPGWLTRLFNVFIQDKRTLVDKRLFITGGVKLESLTGQKAQWQPSGRLLWTPADTTSAWCAVSRAVRNPSMVEQQVILPYTFAAMPPPFIIAAGMGNPDLKPEELIAYEAGTRFEPAKRVSVDVSLFYNIYHRLINVIPYTQLVPYGTAYLTGLRFANPGNGHTWGGETSVQWTPSKKARFALGYAAYDYDSDLLLSVNSSQGSMPPKHLGNARVFLNPLPHLEINAMYYYYGKTVLPFAGINVLNAAMVDITKIDTGRFDLNITLKDVKGFDLIVGGQNLFQDSKTETLADYFSRASYLEPNYYAQLSARF
jgi:iron complex outermembrane receptor protein